MRSHSRGDRSLRHRTLSPCMVDGVLAGQDNLRDRYKGVPLLKQGLDNGGQGLRGMEGCVMEQNDGPGLDLSRDPPGNLPSRQVLPVQGITERNKGKFL